MIGRTIAHYRITAAIAAGGMGEVYLARDTKLQRDVALKILPAAFSRDLDRLARFEREAIVLASLNHPNIAQIFGIEESGDVRALAMELVPGQTLEEMLRGTSAAAPGLPVEEALSIARQMVDALDAAHEAGIVHRDLKPANVKVRDDGVVKVLDFGLASARPRDAAGREQSAAERDPMVSSSPTAIPTVNRGLTEAGYIMGTAAYMAPEQARGRAVDKRADIWAFGVVLYEMLTGRHLFAAETVSDTIVAVLTREPDLAALPSAVPANVRALLARCLERDPKRRLRDIGEARHLLEQTLQTPASSAGAPAPQALSSAPQALSSAPPAFSSSPPAPSSPPEPSAPRVRVEAPPPRARRLRWRAAAVGAALAIAAVILWQRRQAPPAERGPIASQAPGPAQSIAVLPFVNQSGSSDDEYFSDGMTDELASAFMKVPGLRVAARSSAFTFKGKPADAREVGARLHVASVLEGTVRRSGSKLRVTAQLVSTTDGLAIWSERYEREAKDVFKVQDDITAAIVAALRLTLGASAPAAGQTGRAENAEAHDLYLRGRFLMFKQTEDSLRKSLDYFEQALVKDPNYAPAYAGQAFAWAWLADLVFPPREANPKGKAAALKALELDSSNVEARSVLAAILFFYDWDPAASEEASRRAIRDNPNSMDAHNFYALTLCAMKRWDEGLAETQRAIALDPLSPFPNWTRQYCLCLARRYDDVLAQHKKTAELDPNFYYLDSWAGIAYREKKMYSESAAEYERIRQVTGAPVAGQAVTFARMGKTAEARKILQEFLDLSKRRYVSPDQMAMICANLGEKDQAFAWLDKAYEARTGMMALLLTPSYDPIRADPRFTALLKKMRLSK